MIDRNELMDRVIAEYPHDITTVEDAIKCSIQVQQALDSAANVTVAVHKRIERTSPDFTDGLICGYLAYFDHHSGKVLADTDVFTLLQDCLTDERYTRLFNAGWCTGLIEAVIEDRSLFAR